MAAEEKKARTVIMDAETWEKIKEMADAERRTINAQIEVLIINAHEAAAGWRSAS